LFGKGVRLLFLLFLFLLFLFLLFLFPLFLLCYLDVGLFSVLPLPLQLFFLVKSFAVVGLGVTLAFKLNAAVATPLTFPHAWTSSGLL